MSELAYREMSETEQHMLVGWWLHENPNLTTTMLVEKLGIDRTTAWRWLSKAERILPVLTGMARRESQRVNNKRPAG